MTDEKTEPSWVKVINGKRYVTGPAWAASKKARMYGTKLVVMRDGKIIHETPDEFEKRLRAIDAGEDPDEFEKHLPKDVR